tara:strand:+ start:4707 stop:6338 length:1632 start_codon:yes stop_codon:yes gene_type:complete
MSQNQDFNLNQNIDNIKNAGKEALNNVTDFFKSNDNYIYILLSLTIVFFILFVLLSWINYILNLKENSYNNLNTIYPENNSYRTKTFIKGKVNFENPETNLTVSHRNFSNDITRIFKNYYVKSSYNSCCADGYKNNWVDIRALEKCIKQGARFLDFEVYSLNFQPIVAASTANNYNIKETYNYLELNKVFETLHNLAFDESQTQCYSDPMIIHLRLMTENKKIYDMIADYIDTHLKQHNNYLLDSTNTIGNINYDPKNIINAKLETFAKKFIIIAYQSDSVLLNSKLKDKVNLRSGSSYCRLLRYQSIISAGESYELLISETKDKYTIVLPDLENSLENYDYYKALTNGCQIMAMKFQNMDDNLIKYNDYFMSNEAGGYSFVLKPHNLLYNNSETIRVTPSEINLTTSGPQGKILIYNLTNYNTLYYEFYKASEISTTPKLSGYVNQKKSTNNELATIDLAGTIVDNKYYIKFFEYTNNTPSQTALTTSAIQVRATGTEGSANRALFNEYPLDTNDSNNDKFEIIPYTGSDVANIVLNINPLT